MILAAKASSRVVRLLTAVAIIATAAILGAGRAYAGDGVQFSGDCGSTYVNKKVGENEQWAITWQIYRNATGNVLKLDGSTPSFIECTLVNEDETNEIFDCVGSAACTSPPCGGTQQWTPIGSNIAIPLTFFLPPNVDPLNPLDACTPLEQ